MGAYLEDDRQPADPDEGCGDGPGEAGGRFFNTDDRRCYCPVHHRGYWLEDGCPNCRLIRASQAADEHAKRSPLSSVASRDSDPRPSYPGRGSSSADPHSDGRLICGMHPAVAEHLLERCIKAWTLPGLLVALQSWETEK